MISGLEGAPGLRKRGDQGRTQNRRRRARGGLDLSPLGLKWRDVPSAVSSRWDWKVKVTCGQ